MDLPRTSKVGFKKSSPFVSRHSVNLQQMSQELKLIILNENGVSKEGLTWTRRMLLNDPLWLEGYQNVPARISRQLYHEKKKRETPSRLTRVRRKSNFSILLP